MRRDAMHGTGLVIPCYNEARRFDGAALEPLLRDGLCLYLVDDGSTDDTRAVLTAFVEAHPGRAVLLPLDDNRGKGEAVRLGLLRALAASPTIVGYLDADLATTPDEMFRLLSLMEASDTEVLLGARVALLGRRIQRRSSRHYLGRVFASLASGALRLPVYDTQCGAKLFRNTPALHAALREPFLSRWVFDVELIGRLVTGASGVERVSPSRIWEEPLRGWRDVADSKLGMMEMARAALDLGRIQADLIRRRRGRKGP